MKRKIETIKVTDSKGNVQHVPVAKQNNAELIVPTVTAIASNNLAIIYKETARLTAKAHTDKGLSLDESKQLKLYSDIIISWSQEDREARKAEKLDLLSDEELMRLVEDAKKVLGVKNEK